MILVDSDVLIAHLRGHSAAKEWLISSRKRGVLSVSVVTVAEVAGGLRSGERHEARRLLSSFRALPVTEAIAWRAAEFMRSFRRGHSGIGLGDYLVAATAWVQGQELATLNVRHFPMFAGLNPPFRL